MNNSIQQNIFDTIKIVVEDYLKKADFDKTITAYINHCINEDLGLYSISYHGANYEAYGTAGIKYADGIQVYVLKPANDSTNNMFIIGSVTGAQVSISGSGKDTYTKAEINNFIEDLNIEIQTNSFNIDDLYFKLANTNNLLNILNETKQNKLIEGNNITIEGNIISASGDIYSAGQGIDISEENEISTTEPPPIDITFEDYKNLTEEERLANTYYVTDVNIPFEDKFTEIDDNRVSAESTWSSEKIQTEIDRNSISTKHITIDNGYLGTYSRDASAFAFVDFTKNKNMFTIFGWGEIKTSYAAYSEKFLFDLPEGYEGSSVSQMGLTISKDGYSNPSAAYILVRGKKVYILCRGTSFSSGDVIQFGGTFICK